MPTSSPSATRRVLRLLLPLAAVAVGGLIGWGIVSDTDAVGPPRGAVAAATPEAAEAGAEVLREGGNAVDAAVTAALTLFVTEPAGSGLGGQSSFILQRPGSEPVAINGTSFAPSAVPADASEADLVGRRRSTVPNAVRTLDHALSEFGSGKITWARALQRAIEHADEGFALGAFRRVSIVKYRRELAADPASAAVWLRPDGSVPAPGAIIRQPLLAATLRRLAEHGPDDFYTGGIAGEIAADMADNGGWVTAADLRDVEPPIVTRPVTGRYRGFAVHSLPPPAGGWVVAQMLGALDQLDPATMRPGSQSRLVAMARVLRAGHRERAENPIPRLDDYAEEVALRTGPRGTAALAREAGTGETTHLSVIDSDGMAVGVTQSINAYFGARVTHPTLGFLYNDYMREFELGEPSHPYALKARAMPYSSMSATILSRGDEPQLVLGSPGSARIISAVVQVASNWVDGDRDIEAAVAAPRLHPKRAGGPLMTEGTVDADTARELETHGLVPLAQRSDFSRGDLDPYFGGVHAVAIEHGAVRGAADPRRDGTVGYAEPSSTRKAAALSATTSD